jgi:hypothetical protein
VIVGVFESEPPAHAELQKVNKTNPKGIPKRIAFSSVP